MLKCTLIGVLLAAFSFNILHAETKEVVGQMNERRGKIQFDNYRVDLGVVPRGSIHEVEFPFVNNREGALRIFGVHGACGCTAVEFSEGKVYKHKDRGVIKARLDTTDFVGKISKVITVLTNDRRQRVRLLTITANISESVIVEPPLVDFTTKADTILSSVVRIDPVTHRESFKVIKALHSPRIKTKILTPEKGAKLGYRLEVSLGSEAIKQDLREMIVIETNHPNLRKIKIPVVHQYRSPLLSNQEYLEFGAVRAGKSKTLSINLPKNHNLEVSNLRSTMFVNGQSVEIKDKLKIEIVGGASGDIINVSLNNISDQDRGVVYGDIKIEEAASDLASTKLPFYGFFSEDKG